MADIHHGALKFPLPTGWEDGSQVVALGPVEGGFRPNVVVSTEPVGPRETEAQFAARQLANLRQALGGYVLVKEGPATFGRLKGFLREHTFTARGTKLAQLQFYVLTGPVAYTFTYTHLAPRFAAGRRTAEQLLAQAVLDE